MKETKSNYKFLFFSTVLFLIISISTFVTYILSARQINLTYVRQQLTVAGETIKLHLSTEISSELSLIMKLGHSPIIIEYFMNPNDPVLKTYALAELHMFQEYSSEGLVFWVSDFDKIFYAIGTTPYVVDPDLPENYWYNLTLHEAEDFNFNINYNNDLDMINLWLNIPVFTQDIDGNKKPVGMLGTGLNLSKIIELVDAAHRERSRFITAYLFNEYREITVANDFDLVNDKVHLADHLGDAGIKAIEVADSMEDNRGINYIFGENMYRVGIVPAIKDWNIVLSYPLPGMLAINKPMNAVFFGMLFLILALFAVMNIFVNVSNNEMSEQNKHLAEANKKLNMVVQATKIGLWDMEIVNDDLTNPSTVFNWSDEFRHMLGFTDENDFPNLLGSWVDRLHPEDRDQTLEHAVKHILDKTNNTPYDVEYRLLKKNDEYSYFRAYGGTFRNEEGNALRIAGSLMDVTEAKNILLNLEKQRAEAEAANKAKSDFLAKISHEIRTPMNAIIGIAQIQLQKADLRDEYSHALEKIYNSGASLLGIINDILDLSKMETGKMEILPAEYDMPSLLHDAVQLNILQIGSKTIDFFLEIDENLPSRMIGDELRIKQILNNLLSNAIKYTHNGHVKLMVSHSEPYVGDALMRPDSAEDTSTAPPMTKEWGGEGEEESTDAFMLSDTLTHPKDTIFLHFVIEDTGQGMRPDDVQKLFSEYVRFNVNANKTTEGTGIGLNITKNLVELMEGTIKAESEYGVGSKFFVTIKQKAVACEPIGKDLSQQLSIFNYAARKQLTSLKIMRDLMPYGKVLIVDDMETNLYVAEGLMSPYKLQIDTALSGEITIMKITEGNVYDVIFMDHMMPNMDGIETTLNLRAMGYQGAIVALTANAISGNAEMFRQNGFDDFISKPIDIRNLNSVLNTFVRDRHLKSPPTFMTPNSPHTSMAPNSPPTFMGGGRGGKESTDAFMLSNTNSSSTDAFMLSNTNSTLNPKLLELFRRDTEKEIITLKKSSKEGDIKLFTTAAHAMKAILGNIGENEASEKAAALEHAGIEGDKEFIAMHTDSFVKYLEDLLQRLTPKDDIKTEHSFVEEDTEYLIEQLHIIERACEEYSDKEIYTALDLLKEKSWKAETSATLEKIHSLVFLHSDFEEAMNLTKTLFKNVAQASSL